MPLPEALREKMIRGIVETIPFVHRSQMEVDELDVGYVKMRMPFEPNVNHVGMMYAGALFTLAEVPGGAIFMSTFDAKKYFPLVKSLDIKFIKPAMSDITVEVRLSPEEAAEIAARADENGKADYEWSCELKDASGQVVAITQNRYQMRRHPGTLGVEGGARTSQVRLASARASPSASSPGISRRSGPRRQSSAKPWISDQRSVARSCGSRSEAQPPACAFRTKSVSTVRLALPAACRSGSSGSWCASAHITSKRPGRSMAKRT